MGRRSIDGGIAGKATELLAGGVDGSLYAREISAPVQGNRHFGGVLGVGEGEAQE